MMRRWAVLLMPWLLASCSKFDLAITKEQLVLRLGTTVILPRYQAFADAATTLSLRATDFQEGPGTVTLAALHDAWIDARRAWGLCEAHFCGPEEDQFLNARIDTFPASASQIEAIISGTDTLTPLYVQALGGSRRGFMAIEYLIFDAAGNGATIVTAMTTGPDAARRLVLAVLLCQDLAATAAQIRNLWDPASGDFLTKFTQPGSAKSPFASAQAALDDLINRMIAFAEFTADNRLGVPLGLANGGSGVPDATKVEASIADSSKDDLLADLQGLRTLYAVLGTYVRQTSPEIDTTIQGSLDQAIAAVQAIPGPLDTALTANPSAVVTAYNCVKDVKVRLAVDMVSVFQSTLTFSPFDGD